MGLHKKKHTVFPHFILVCFFFVPGTGTSTLHNIVLASNGSVESAALLSGEHKLVWGDAGDTDGWFYTDGTSEDAPAAYATYPYRLFNVYGETPTNVASVHLGMGRPDARAGVK